MKNNLPSLFALVTVLTGCFTMTPAPQWKAASDAAEAQYRPYLAGGKCSLTGQAFLVQSGGDTVKAAGRTVTLDPATSVGNEWWTKVGRSWEHRELTPPSPGFAKARRTTVADADGRFKFSGLTAAKYYVRTEGTEVTWEAGRYSLSQRGLVGQPVEVRDGRTTKIIVNQFSP